MSWTLVLFIMTPLFVDEIYWVCPKSPVKMEHTMVGTYWRIYRIPKGLRHFWDSLMLNNEFPVVLHYTVTPKKGYLYVIAWFLKKLKVQLQTSVI